MIFVTLRSIQQNHPDPDLKRASGIVIDAVNRLELINFAVHPKGHGVVSKIRIPKGTVVGEYFGEVYPAWRWAEKQAEDEAEACTWFVTGFLEHSFGSSA